jgi:hypothetical protein
VVALYFNAFVLVAQLFHRIPAGFIGEADAARVGAGRSPAATAAA